MTDRTTDTHSDDTPLFVQRWVEKPDGKLELVEIPLTPEIFLDPQLEDKMTQGERHSKTTRHLSIDIESFLLSKRDDVLVLSDVKHYLGIPGLPNPSPDVSVIYGIRRRPDEEWPISFDLIKEKAKPSFILEVVSPEDRRLREVDEVDKVKIYQTAGVLEYFLVDTPRRRNGFRFSVKGFRLDSEGRYQPIQPDPEGRLLSEQTGLWFPVSSRGDRMVLVDAATTSKKVLSREEQEAARRAAEEKTAREAERAARESERAEREAEARRAAEAELARLRERLKEMGGLR